MPSLIIRLFSLTIALLCLLFPSFSHAAEHSPELTATVPEFKISAPILIAPSNHALTNNPREPFEWLQGASIQGISYHTFYLDGQPIIPKILTSIPEINTLDYYLRHHQGRIYLTFKNPFTDGVHTWQVSATSDGGTTAYSDLWRFTIDSTLPLIILRQVDQNYLYWATHDPHSIPPYQNRHLTVTTPNPLLLGQVEALVSFKYALICPQNAPAGCREQSITVYESDGNFAHRFTDLEPHYSYFVYLIATDLAGNTNYFPVFTITYTPQKPLITLPPVPGIITPTPTPPPAVPPLIPEPTPLPPLPPAPPLPPPITPEKLPDYLRLFHALIIFGLLIHISLGVLGAKIKVQHIHRFITQLFIPITRGQKHYTNPYTTIEIYHPDHLDKIIKNLTANPFGAFSLPRNLPQTIFVRLTRPGLSLLTWLTPPTDLPSHLFLNKNTTPSLSDRLRVLCFHLRFLPLIVAIATSSYAVHFTSHLFFVIYLIASLNLFFTQYLLPPFLKPDQNQQAPTVTS